MQITPLSGKDRHSNTGMQGSFEGSPDEKMCGGGSASLDPIILLHILEI